MLDRTCISLALAGTITAGGGIPAQSVVSVADVEHLENALFHTGTVLSRLRTGDAVLRKQLLAEIADIRDEVDELSARLREQEPVPRLTYTRLRDRIAEVSRRARSEITVTGSGGEPMERAPYPTDDTSLALRVQEGAPLWVELLTRVDPETARVGDRVEAVSIDDYVVDEIVIIPSGSLVRGVVMKRSRAPGQASGHHALGLRFVDVLVDFRTHPIQAQEHDDITAPLGMGSRLQIRFD